MDITDSVPRYAETFVVLPGKTETNTPIFAVLVKRTYNIQHGQQTSRAERTQPWVEVDIYYDHGDPESATVQYETDLVPYKLATDVVCIGKAYAPQLQPVAQMDVILNIAPHSKTL